MKIALVDGRFNLSYFRSHETIARFSNSSRLWVEGGAEKSGVMPVELRGPGGWGEKLLFSESPPASLTPPHTSSSTPTTFMDKLRGGQKRPSTSPAKVLTIFRQGSSSQPPRSPLQCVPQRRSRGAYDAPSIIRAYSSGFCSRSRIRKMRENHTYLQSLRCTSSSTNEKYTSILSLLLSSLRETIFPLNFQRQFLSSRLKITQVGRLNFINQLLLIFT